ncbi:MAG: CinA family nicotinamide mononucleotide deamidase-related protein [Planctomycetota bacterium]|nr:CinA family nicotinamide mononucleotide deamidase-related protein [Planctomycetota bacterium]
MNAPDAQRPHATAALLSIGDELTLGQTLDTNSKWLAARLLDLGVTPIEHATVPDELQAHADAYRRLARKADLVISSGGLGPTADDLTRQALAQAMNDELVEDPGALAEIQTFFRGRARTMPEINRVQALRPRRGISISNPNGTAPGLLGLVAGDAPAGGGVEVFCLPGPPREMIPMFESFVVPRIRVRPGWTVLTRVIPTIGIGESDLASRLGDLMRRDRVPLVGTTASAGVVTVRIRYEGQASREQALRELDETQARVLELASDFVFATEPTTLQAAMIGLLRQRGQTLTTVESCTGGMLGSLLTEVPGSSSAYRGGWVTYSNERKVADVGVPRELFMEWGGESAPGAVSPKVAIAMAQGGLERAGADHALSITGVAGPEGGTPDKPVGTVWVGRASRRESVPAGTPLAEARRFSMGGDRASVREWSCRAALAMLRLAMLGKTEVKLLREAQVYASAAM